MSPSIPQTKPVRRAMPLRHKLMLALACEVLLIGFQRADLSPRRAAGILIEAPAVDHHVIT
jgi:hypothetical protein